MTPFWVVAPGDVRTWSSTHADHKQGWVRAGCRLRVVESYKDFYRVDQLDGPNEVSTSAAYSEIWVYKVDVVISEAPTTSPPGTVSEAAAFAAFQTLMKYLKTLK
jgi:hypothetical protein